MKTEKNLLIAIGLLLLIGCSKNQPQYPEMPTGAFPHYPGCQWTYLATTNNTLTDTLALQITSYTGYTTFANFNCNILANGINVGSATYSATEIGLIFTPDSPYSVFPGFQLAFPLYNNQTWGTSGVDTASVTYLASYQGLDSVYHGVYKVHFGIAEQGYSEEQTLIIAPNIGLIYELYSGNTFTAQSTQYEFKLLSFHQ